jgi:hypothetical protein
MSAPMDSFEVALATCHGSLFRRIQALTPQEIQQLALDKWKKQEFDPEFNKLFRACTALLGIGEMPPLLKNGGEPLCVSEEFVEEDLDLLHKKLIDSIHKNLVFPKSYALWRFEPVILMGLARGLNDADNSAFDTNVMVEFRGGYRFYPVSRIVFEKWQAIRNQHRG